MALVKCPECGHEISTAAPVCPNCGYSFMFAPPTRAKATSNLLVLIIGAIVSIVMSKIGWVTFLIGGVVVEFVVAVITTLMALLFGNRSVRIVLYFLVFDLGYILAYPITFFIR